ncbi:Rha family transcriptional regulator [Comamonas aquatica]|uniref:Rha family transcriptional regulator n=1 Tax=Comamonas aquatica TaxID=225991 RepID=UPI002447C66E|nr:Rha family transcriptional regulator [Comamonas aquatica]MDH0901362.1 Rha family transcriptional regulator [Comamonas aquatica]
MPKQKQLPKSKGKLVSLLNVGNELRVDSRLLAEKLQNQHKHVYELIEKYFEQFCRFGKVPFETEPLPSGQKAKFALLNEDQSYFLLSLSRNTEHVVELKANLVAAFSKARQPQGPEEEYLPTYRALHDSVDSLASESKNKKFVHMNFNKLINSTVGVEAGKRHDLPVPRKALMVVAQATAAHALSTAKDHHDGYQLAKTAMQALKPVAQQLSGQTNLPIG